MSRIYLFEDQNSHYFSPLSDTRHVACLRIGCTSLFEYLRAERADVYVVTERKYIQEYYEETVSLSDASVWHINARLLPKKEYRDFFLSSPSSQEEISLWNGEELIAYYGPSFPDFSYRALLQQAKRVNKKEKNFSLIKTWADIFTYHEELLHEHLQEKIRDVQGIKQYRENVYVLDGVDIDETVVFDVSNGPVFLEKNVKIKPFSYLRGPVWLGKCVCVNEHTSIKDAVSVGAFSKVGGEIETSVIYEYSNKQHFGFLGHSIIGSWVNLGAGTTNSDLKNTYGVIHIQCGEEKVDTQRQFLGCAIGDYAKTAIHTAVLTGKTIGVNSHVFGIVQEDVSNFQLMLSALGGEDVVFRLDAALKTQERMFVRRNKEILEKDKKLLEKVFEFTP